jgi:hypothetical protein
VADLEHKFFFVGEAASVVYWPVAWTCNESPRVNKAVIWYVGLWVDYNKAPGVNLPPAVQLQSSCGQRSADFSPGVAWVVEHRHQMATEFLDPSGLCDGQQPLSRGGRSSLRQRRQTIYDIGKLQYHKPWFEARTGLGECLFTSGQLDEARSVLQQAVS